MVDTCFLCAVGAVSAMTTPAAQSTDEFGTCYGCNVHACPQHGERLEQYFRCTDCISGTSARRALNSPDGDRDAAAAPWWIRAINRFGISRFFAEAPATARSGLRLYHPRWVDPMHAALREWAESSIASLLEVLQRQLTDQLTDQPLLAAPALGLRIEQQVAIEQTPIGLAEGTARFIDNAGQARVGLIFDEIGAVAERNGRDKASFDVTRNRAEYALAVLCAALAARESELGASVLEVPGGLLMPPFVVLLNALFTRHHGGEPTATATSEAVLT